MHDRHQMTERRLERALRDRLRDAAYGDAAPFHVTAYEVPGVPITFDDVMLARAEGLFRPFAIGEAWGPPWGTTWFHFVGAVPNGWSGATVEARVDLGFGPYPGFQAEGLVWGPDGPVRALNPLNHAIPLLQSAAGGEQFEFLVEAAANPLIARRRSSPTPLGDPNTLPDELLYTLNRAELAIRRPEVAALVLDLEVLGDLVRELPSNAPRRPQITIAIGRALDVLDLADVPATAARARAQLAPMLARPAVPSAHHVSAIGHAHIDTAWLWPLRETVRKCARTFSNVLDLMTREPELRFVCSQAQQHEWMRTEYPSIFEAMKERAAEGRFIPVGGMWVEADMNIPSGESLARQLLHGQRFFEQHYGAMCEEIWIPDVFGYPASLPQIFALGGARWFLTQKLSWNRQNRMPHHTFWWQGIDGTRIFTHFPPVDTYNVSMTPAEMAHAERNYADHGGGTMSMAPFGYGNGGGGPTREMMERYRRMRDLEGLPSLSIDAPAEFFEAALHDYPDAPTWVGELYLERHRGTFTSQAHTKSGNRRTEILLCQVELLSTLAAAQVDGFEYPYDELEAAWREALTLQFHDIIPGSSIAWVHDDAEQAYERLVEELTDVRERAIVALVGEVGGAIVLVNSSHVPRAEVIELDAALAGGLSGAQVLSDGRVAAWAELGTATIAPLISATRPEAVAPVVVSRANDDVIIDNGIVQVTIDRDGLITSIIDRRVDREVVRAGERANVLELSNDHPVEFDAWDLEEHYVRSTVVLTAVENVEVGDVGPLVGSVRVVRQFGASSISQLIVVRAGSSRIDVVNDVEWHENEKVLQVAMPVDVQADEAACGIQFGHVMRPTHASTNWDAAKFEVCAQGWVDVSEHGYGVALLDECKYGRDIQRGALRLTLLRAAMYPDPDADRGSHHFTYALFPHVGGLVEGDVGAEARRLDESVIVVAGDGGPCGMPLTAVRSSNPSVVCTAVKLAEDGSGDVVIRCYEAAGSRTRTTLSFGFDAATVTMCDLLERHLPSAQGCASLADDGTVDLQLRPFQIATLRLTCRCAVAVSSEG